MKWVPLLLLLILLGACSRSKVVESSTSVVLDAAAMRQQAPGALLGDAGYAQVNSLWLPGFYDTFRSELFRQGVVKGDPRFDCNHFAAYYSSLAQTQFYLRHFQGGTKAQSLAVGVCWFNSARGPHAVVMALTERGALYIEPQTGRELNLTEGEKQSAWLRLF